MKKGVTEKKIDARLYSFTENSLKQGAASNGLQQTEEITFSDRFDKRKKVIIHRFQPKKRFRHMVAAVMSLLVVASAGITASGLWEEIWTLTLETGDKFVSIFTGRQEDINMRQAKDMILVKQVPKRFSLGEIQNKSNLVFYLYTAENGDILTVSEEKGNQEKEADAETSYEVVIIAERDVFLSYKEEKQEYCICFQYDADTLISITGNISREEALEIVQLTFDKL